MAVKAKYAFERARLARQTLTARQSRLLALPTELRLLIYELAVTVDGPIAISPHAVGCEVDDMEWLVRAAEEKGIQPALTRTCSEIRIAVLPLYYSSNDFVAILCRYDFGINGIESKLLTAWLTAIGPANRSQLRSLTTMEPKVLRTDNRVEATRPNEDVMALLKAGDFTKLGQPDAPWMTYNVYFNENFR